MNSREAKSSSELKQEVLQELRQVNNDVLRIQGRLTPGQLIDDVLMRSGPRNTRAVFDHLKDNPVGTVFLGLGTLLLMEDESNVTYESRMREQTKVISAKARDQAEIARYKVHQMNKAVQGAGERASQKMHNVKSKVEELKNKVSKTAKTGEEQLGEGGELGISSLDEVKDEIADKVVSFTDTVRELDPMTFIAIGAGLGALTGMSLPVSDQERSFVDQQMGSRLTGLGGELEQALNESANILKSEFLNRFTDFDVSIFNRNKVA